jgi:hypothetical protein
VELASVPLEQRVDALIEVLLAEPMSVWRRAELVAAALWPQPARIPATPPPRPVWRKRGLASTPLERAEALDLVAQGWSCRAAADALGWHERQVRMWARRARQDAALSEPTSRI